MSEEAVKDGKEEELESDSNRKNRIAVVYGKQDYMWKVQWTVWKASVWRTSVVSMSGSQVLHRFSEDFNKTYLVILYMLLLRYFVSCMLCVCVYTRVNLSMWRWSVKSWRPTQQSISLQDSHQICPASSETTAYWLRNTSYDFSVEPRSDKRTYIKRWSN